MVAKKIEDTTEPQAKTATKKAASAPQSPAGEAHTAGSGKKPADKKPVAKKPAAKKPAAKKPASDKASSKQARAAQANKPGEKPSAVSTKDLVFHAPDPALLPVFTPAPEESQSEGTVRRRSRANRPTLSPEEKKAKAAAEASTPQKVRGSTRLEAKRQRRRDGRDGGRRRQSVTESEFLARRESVDRVMVVRERTDRTQIAVLEDNVGESTPTRKRAPRLRQRSRGNERLKPLGGNRATGP